MQNKLKVLCVHLKDRKKNVFFLITFKIKLNQLLRRLKNCCIKKLRRKIVARKIEQISTRPMTQDATTTTTTMPSIIAFLDVLPTP